MSEIDFRTGKKPFYDNQKFRRGFAKSGNFTIAEEEILIRYGDTFLGLEKGELTPQSDVEKHFLLALSDESKAESKLEKTWIKYCHQTRDRRKFHTLNGKKPDIDDSAHTYEPEDDLINDLSDDDNL